MVAFESIAAALLYFYPVAQYARTYGPVIDRVGTNVFEHQTSLSSAGAEAVVTRANADTLYSLAAIDLSKYDVVFTIPEILNRTHIFPFHDFYGNNFATLGSYNNASAGRWLLRLAQPGQPAIEVVSEEEFSEYTGFVNYPTTYGSIFPRLLLFNRPDDLEKIKATQKQMVLESVPKTVPCTGCPKLTNDLLGTHQVTPASFISPAEYSRANATLLLQVAARTFAFNRPTSQEDINPAVLSNLTISCGPAFAEGSCEIPSCLNFTRVQQTAAIWMAAEAANPDNFHYLPNDAEWKWSSVLGRFNSAWIIRAVITTLGYLATDPDQYIPPNYVGKAAATNETSLIMTFHGKPPMKDDGFWSVTCYDSNGFLVENPLNRYAIGDRSNLTYPDGSLVYASEDDEETQDDGDFQVLVQSASITPPANWTSNWLPSPPDAASGFFLRFYGPTKELSDGSYRFPTVLQVPAIRASSRAVTWTVEI